MIYFIQNTASGQIKIGRATNPWTRMAVIQCHCPDELRLLALEEGSAERERELHARFRSERLRGEWFGGSPELMAHIATLPVAARPLSRTRQFWGGKNDAEVSVETGISKAALVHIRAGNRRTSVDQAIRLQRATGKSAIWLVFRDLTEEAF